MVPGALRDFLQNVEVLLDLTEGGKGQGGVVMELISSRFLVLPFPSSLGALGRGDVFESVYQTQELYSGQDSVKVIGESSDVGQTILFLSLSCAIYDME